MLIKMRSKFDSCINGLMAGYYDRAARKAIDVVRVYPGKPEYVPDQIGRKILEANGNIFREVKDEQAPPAEEQEEFQSETPIGGRPPVTPDMKVAEMNQVFQELNVPVPEASIPKAERYQLLVDAMVLKSPPESTPEPSHESIPEPTPVEAQVEEKADKENAGK